MKPTEVPKNEIERSKFLKTYAILDTLLDDGAFTKIADAICIKTTH